MACPTLYPGQVVRASVEADAGNLTAAGVTFYLRYFGGGDALQRVCGPKTSLEPGERAELYWEIPEAGRYPIAEIGLEIDSAQGRPGTVYLDQLGWSGTPNTIFAPPTPGPNKAWQTSWINAATDFSAWEGAFRVIQDEGTGLLIQGTSDWQDYRVETVMTPHMAAAFGLAARVQGLRRYYALIIGEGSKARLVKVFHDQTMILGEADLPWEFGQPAPLALEVSGAHIKAFANGTAILSAFDNEAPFLHGGIALLVTEGRAAAGPISIQPLEPLKPD